MLLLTRLVNRQFVVFDEWRKFGSFGCRHGRYSGREEATSIRTLLVVLQDDLKMCNRLNDRCLIELKDQSYHHFYAGHHVVINT